MKDYKTQTFSKWLREKTRDPKIDTQVLCRKTEMDRYTFAALIDARITPEQVKNEVLENLYDFLGERYVEVVPIVTAQPDRIQNHNSEELTEDDLFQAVK